MTIKTSFRIISLIIFSCALSACSGLMFYPDTPLVRTPETLGLAYQDIVLEAADGLKIHVIDQVLRGIFFQRPKR